MKFGSKFRNQNRNMRIFNFDSDSDFLGIFSSNFDSEILKFWFRQCQNRNERSKFSEVRIFAHPYMFIITFLCFEDKDHILYWRSWLFDNHLFVLKSFDDCVQPTNLSFDSEEFGVQFYDLPFASMNKETGEMLESPMRKVKDVNL